MLKHPSQGLAKDLKKPLCEALDSIWADLDVVCPVKLYHYTTLEGLDGILRNKQLWVSDIARMDDDQETTYARKRLWEVAQKSSIPKRFRQLLEMPTLFGMSEQWYAYIACFSAESDSCQQWCDYADRGRGCALVIDFAKLLGGAGAKYALFPVLYDTQEQRKRIKLTFDVARNVVEKLGLDAKFEHALEATLVKAALLTAVRLKRPDCSHQREWRLLILQTDCLGTNSRQSSRGPIQYLSLEFDRSALRAIKAGPSASTTKIAGILDEHRAKELPLIASQLDPRDCDCTMNSDNGQ